jgi:small multidrug resistance family-3 protein
MLEIKTVILFLVTAVAEILACYLPYVWLKQGEVSGCLFQRR